jgi:hypothetical protein
METTTRRQALLRDIYERLEQAYEDTLEDVLELLKAIDDEEDEEDIRDARIELEDIKKNGGIPWEEMMRGFLKSPQVN